MIDDLVKESLRNELRNARADMLVAIDGLSEYNVRRPLTASGTNLLGLIKHLATWESRYLGEVFDRPFPEPLPPWDDAATWGDDLWVTEHESRDEIIDLFARVWDHGDATITALSLDAPGYVPWWPRPEVTLLNVLAHRIGETARHAGHADILRELLASGAAMNPDITSSDNRFQTIERAAQAATSPTSPG